MKSGKIWKLARALGVFCVLLATTKTHAAELPPLPQGLASFGAATLGHYLYVYGGHTGVTHVHSADDLSRRFLRLDLDAPRDWEELGEVEALQGLALVAFEGGVCRVGGMKALNHRGEPEDLVSIAEVSCWQPEERAWKELPPLPEPRSSHDAVVHEGKIYVAGGWRLPGQGAKGVWASEMLVYEPAQGAWKPLPQSFERRALAVVAAQGKIWAIGGIGRQGTSSQVDAFDVHEEKWSPAGKLPYLGDLDGFGAAAVAAGGGILLSASDGILQGLAGDLQRAAWRDVGQRWQKQRFFHRMVVYKGELLAIAGATPEGHTPTLEEQPVPPLEPLVANASASQEATEGTAAMPGVWPGFRGHGDGQAPIPEMPLEAKVAWRLAVPGYGQSSPVIWGDQVFLTSVVGAEKEELVLSAFDLQSGEVRWRRRFVASLRLEAKETVSRAAPTPVVDEERVYAFWESGDLLALDHRGETLWRRELARDYGVFEGNHGIASSPVLAGDRLIVQITHAGPSYLLGIETASGKTVWKEELAAKVAWTTPLVLPLEPAVVVVSSNGSLEGFDTEQGKRVFRLEGLEKNVSASPVLGGDVLLAPSGEATASVALRLDVRGELGSEAILWRALDASAGFASPVYAAGCFLFVNKSVLACVDPASGETRWKERLADEVWASPIAAGKRVFFFTKKGKRLVYEVGLEAGHLLAEEDLATEDVLYGAAASRGAFFLRTGHEILRLTAMEPAGVLPPTAP